MNKPATTLQQLTDARDLMQHYITQGFSWQMRAHQERRINQLREQLQAENAQYMRDQGLLTQIFS